MAVLNPLAQIGGAEISLTEVLRRTGNRFRFHLIVPEEGPLIRRALEAGVQVSVLPWPERLMRFGERNKTCNALGVLDAALLIRQAARDFSRHLQGIHADLLITNGIKCHLVGAAASKGRHTPLLWYMRDGLEGRRLSSLALRFCAGRCTACIAISRYVAGDAHRVLGKGVPVHVLYNIVDLERFRPGLPVPTDLRKAEGEIWYGVIGPLTPLKGQDLFLDAAIRVTRAVPHARFILVGGNFYRTEEILDYEGTLKTRLEGTPLRDRVRFLGHREDVPDVLSALDVLVQPNRGPEGLGRSILEAMACGVPVIAVNRWGPGEIVKHGETGLLFPWMDTAGLAQAMVQLGTRPDLRNSLASNALKWIAEFLRPERLSEQFVGILNGVIGNPVRR